ncbi:MAG: hypothetical protein ACR2FH_11770, partial [Caulobacteraceae bacterium]
LCSARPALGHADYCAPVRGLYMCGSGTHPGGGITGAPGHNAAREVSRDLGRATPGRIDKVCDVCCLMHRTEGSLK